MSGVNYAVGINNSRLTSLESITIRGQSPPSRLAGEVRRGLACLPNV